MLKIGEAGGEFFHFLGLRISDMACLGSARLSQVYTTPSVAASVPRNGSSSGGLAGQELKAACVPFPVRSSNGECSNGVFCAHKVVKGLRSGGVVRSEFLKGGDHGELLRRVVGEVQDVAAAKKTTNKKKTREAGTVMAMAVSTTDEKKLLKGRCGAILEDVPHLTDWLPDLPVRSEGWLTRIQPADRTNFARKTVVGFLVLIWGIEDSSKNVIGFFFFPLFGRRGTRRVETDRRI